VKTNAILDIAHKLFPLLPARTPQKASEVDGGGKIETTRRNKTRGKENFAALKSYGKF
jgi:hypothetical protein